MKQVPKYPRTRYWPWSPSVEKGDKVHPCPEFFLHKNIVITEKIDGSNTCLHKGEVYARSTGQPSTNGWHAMVKKHHAWKAQRNDVFLYGEDIFGVHSLEYGPIKEDETFRLFAVRYGNGGEKDWFADWGLVEKIANELEIKTVPVLFKGKFSSIKEITTFCENHLLQGSFLGYIGFKTEGCVIRTEDSFLANNFVNNVCKWVRPNHIQTDEHWTKNWKHCELKQ